MVATIRSQSGLQQLDDCLKALLLVNWRGMTKLSAMRALGLFAHLINSYRQYVASGGDADGDHPISPVRTLQLS